MDDRSKNNGPWWQAPLLFFSKLNAWIIGPVLTAFIIGEFIDRKYGTGEWGKVIAIMVSFAFSVIKMVMIAKEELKKKNPKS